MRCARWFVAVSLLGSLTACGDVTHDPPPEPAIVDEDVLARFVGAEQRLDAAALAGALAAGADLAQAGDGIRREWDESRRRVLSSVGPKGVAGPDATPGSPRFTLAGVSGAELAAPTPVRDGFDFASMAWATWSLGLLYLGNDAAGTVEHGPSVSGQVTTRDSTTVTAAKRGPVAGVTLSTTRSQTSTAGWSVAQTGLVKLDLPLCPDAAGVIAFDMTLELKTTGSSAAGGTSTVTDVLKGRTTATVNDEARLASVVVTGTYDHNGSATGPGLAMASGESGIHVNAGDGAVTVSVSGNATGEQGEEARGYGATLLWLAGALATARAGDFYEKGYCTEVLASPDDGPTEVAVGATKPFDVRVRHKWDGVELTDRITSRLEGAQSVSPTERTASPTTLTYVAPSERNRQATIHIESRSRRGIARRDVAVRTPGGYAIHDVWTLGNGAKQHMDAVNCDSAFGPWHVVVSGDLAALGWRSLNAWFDIAGDPTTGTGTLTGEEHSVTTGGDSYDGPSTGTATFRPEGDGYLVKLEIDYSLTWRSRLGSQPVNGHSSRELRVIPATDEECGS